MRKMPPVPLDSAGSFHRPFHASHFGVEHFDVGHARHLDVAELAEGPPGVVVDALLRIVGRPVLVVEQRVGDAAVGLVHAHHVGAGGEGAGRTSGFSAGLAAASVAVSPVAPPRPPRPARASFLAVIMTVNGSPAPSRSPGPAACAAGPPARRGADRRPETHSGRTLGARFLDRALGLQVEIVQKQLVVRGEVRERRQHAGLFV